MNVACPKNKSTKKPISSCIRIVGESIFRYDVEKKWGKRAIGKTFKESLLELLQVIILKFDPEPKNDGIDVEPSDDDIGFGGADNYDDDFQGPDDYMDKDSQPGNNQHDTFESDLESIMNDNPIEPSAKRVRVTFESDGSFMFEGEEIFEYNIGSGLDE
ncbi:Afg3l1 [Acrasis kona]|uniref:Afg3l1 n=1 Tax=Acrasis kona TaxID=1008807 RepID=A0AAW2ZDN6_9EUKA